MKFSKLFVRILIGCLLLGASGAAMARNDCGTASNGAISNQTLDEFVMDEFDICTLSNVTVEGDVRVVGADGFTMINSTVKGNVIVTAAVTNFRETTSVVGSCSTALARPYPSPLLQPP